MSEAASSPYEPERPDGWVIHAFEPDPANRQELRRRVGGLPNVVIDERAVGPEDGRRVALYTSVESTGISTLRPFHSSHRPTSEVLTVRLDTYLADVQSVTFLKVDAEGQDLPVLQTFPWSRVTPRAVLCEFEDSKTEPVGYAYHDLAQFLTGLGYDVLVSEWFPVTRYGRRHRWRSLRSYPVALSDPNAWGNLIAVDPALAEETTHHGRWRARSRAFWERVRGRATRGPLRV